MKTTIINLYGGPGTGKSTSAAYLYYLLKIQGINAELVREYVKDWAWEGRHISVNDQIYFLGKQVRRESMLYGKVNWIITDSPVWMNAFYASHYCTEIISTGVSSLVKAYYQQVENDGHRHIHVFLNRTKPYLAEGRYQTEEEAKHIDHGVKEMLLNKHIPFIEADVGDEGLQNLLKLIRDTKAA
jgi:deoxyadenosine/deoxycytidine kinase